jgi:uncharacterized protein (DUF1778 family)
MKTVTMRVDDSTYDMIKLAAEGQKRNLSNFIEFATLQYLTSSYIKIQRTFKQLEFQEKTCRIIKNMSFC